MTSRRAEARIRSAWSRRPPGLLRLASSAYEFGTGLRNLLYDSGVLASQRVSVPVVSVGGLTAGGSGKTPLAVPDSQAGTSPKQTTARQASAVSRIAAATGRLSRSELPGMRTRRSLAAAHTEGAQRRRVASRARPRL